MPTNIMTALRMKAMFSFQLSKNRWGRMMNGNTNVIGRVMGSHNLGLLYYDQGKLAEAMNQRLLEAQSQFCQPPMGELEEFDVKDIAEDDEKLKRIF
jgi:hypothetical protein